MHVLMIISILTREFTQISHISKFTRHFFEYRYMHDAADNGMLPEQITLFPKTDCKSEYIVIY